MSFAFSNSFSRSFAKTFPARYVEMSPTSTATRSPEKVARKFSCNGRDKSAFPIKHDTN